MFEDIKEVSVSEEAIKEAMTEKNKRQPVYQIGILLWIRREGTEPIK